MFRQIPTVNKICQKRQVEQDQVRLEQRLKRIQAQIDTSSPQTFEYGNQFNRKKNQIQENQYTEIERENKILLEKITKVMSKDPQQKNVQQTQQMLQHNQMLQNKKSLNSAQRKKELIKITVENQHFLKRLKGMKSDYEQKKQMKSWGEQQEIVSRISEYGTMSRRFNSKSSMQSRSLPKGVHQGLNDNMPSQSSIPASANLTHRQKSTLETLDYQPLKKRVGSGYLGGNGNKLQRNLSGITGSTKKVVLLKKSKKIGLNYYLIEIYIEDGLFRIVADDAENPTRKVLEMSESDGTKIIRKYFGNSLEQLLESIWITDRIFIRGLEAHTTEEAYHSRNSNQSHSVSPTKLGQICKTQPDEKPKQLAPLAKSTSNKSLNGEGAKLYNKQLSSHMEIIEQPDQELEMSTSNLINSRLHGNNHKRGNKKSIVEEESEFSKSGENQSVFKSIQENKSQMTSKSMKIDEDGFNEYGEEDYDDNESEHIQQIKKQGHDEDENEDHDRNKEGEEVEEEEDIENSQNMNNDF